MHNPNTFTALTMIHDYNLYYFSQLSWYTVGWLNMVESEISAGRFRPDYTGTTVKTRRAALLPVELINAHAVHARTAETGEID